MKIVLKIFAGLLILLNAFGAIYGGLHLITYPDGSSLKMSLLLLEHSPFKNYLIPGIILLFANGIFSLFVFVSMLSHTKHYALLIIAQGCILTGWILVQTIMIRTFVTLQLIYLISGILLIICGYLLHRPGKQERMIAGQH